MDAQRFEQFTAAYGGDPIRWPEAERGAALAFQRDHRATAERILFEARLIDAALAAAPSQAASAGLRERVLAAAPRPRPQRLRLAAPGWLPGAGLAAACAVGVLAGSLAVERVSAPIEADMLVAEAAPAMEDVEVAG